MSALPSHFTQMIGLIRAEDLAEEWAMPARIVPFAISAQSSACGMFQAVPDGSIPSMFVSASMRPKVWIS